MRPANTLCSTHTMNTPVHTTHPEPPRTSTPIETAISQRGQALSDTINRVLDPIPAASQGPQRLAEHLGVDKVLASRLLKALKSASPMNVVHRIPGPEPLRRVVRAAARHGARHDDVDAAQTAIDQYERFLKVEIGDRSALDAILSAWIPEARRDFELRRKQAAFRALSQLRGVSCDCFAETAFVLPSEDPNRIDIAWLRLITGIQRIRPNARVRLSSIRIDDSTTRRRPVNLKGAPIASLADAVVERFSTAAPESVGFAALDNSVHYMLADDAFGPSDAIDLCTAEVNRAEIDRYVHASRNRRAWFSSEVVLPAKKHQFDIFVHRDLFHGAPPILRLYDTSVVGLSDPNDPTSTFAEMDLVETVESLGPGLSRARADHAPAYIELLEHAAAALRPDPEELNGHRVAISYPIVGTQAALLFPTVDPPTA